MEKNDIKWQKKMAQLYCRDRVLELEAEGKSISEITDLINRRLLPFTKHKGITLSRSTIYKIIKTKEQKK